jgi:hypothetical protein
MGWFSSDRMKNPIGLQTNHCIIAIEWTMPALKKEQKLLICQIHLRGLILKALFNELKSFASFFMRDKLQINLRLFPHIKTG